MTAIAKVEMPDSKTLETVLVQGDLSALTAPQRVTYYMRVCESVGLNPLTQPFEYLKLNGKLVLYGKRSATDQLRKIHGISTTIIGRERIDDLYIVTARATAPDGRTDESTGVVALASLKGENLANALMKAETKAKRRVTMSICGLSLLDETEVETIPAQRITVNHETGEVIEARSVAQLPAPKEAPRLSQAQTLEDALAWCRENRSAVRSPKARTRVDAEIARIVGDGVPDAELLAVRKMVDDALGVKPPPKSDPVHDDDPSDDAREIEGEVQAGAYDD